MNRSKSSGATANCGLLGPTERELSVGQLVELAADPPANAGSSAQAAFAIVGLAQRAVSEGLVHPQLLRGGSSWFAFWGVTLDDSLQAELDAIAAAAPAASGAIDELLPHLVDRIARDRLDGVRLAPPTRSPAMDAFLIGLAADQPDLPDGPSYASLERRLSRWVDSGLGELKESPWLLGFHLDERPGSDTLALELWLHASDDPTLSLPASLLWQGSEGFEFVRDGDPYGDLAAQLEELAPLLAEGGIAFDDDEPSEVDLDTDDTTFFLKHLMPLLEKAGVPVLLPSAWVRSPTRIRANLTASGAARSQAAESAGFMSTTDLAQFDWKLAVGDVDLSEDELRALAAAKAPVVLRGRPLARAAPVGGRPRAQVPREAQGGRRCRRPRARHLGHRGRRGGARDGQRRARPGAREPARGRHALPAAADAAGDDLRAVRVPGARPRLAAHAGRPRDRRDPRRRHGPRQDGAGDRDAALRARGVRARAARADARRLPDERRAPVARRGRALRAVAARAPASRQRPARRRGAAQEASARSTSSITSYDIVTRDIDTLGEIRWDRLLLDEAQDVKNPATKRARALRQISARRRVAMTGTPIENHLGELWALMDILNPGLLGSREWFGRTFARPIQLANDEPALERLRAVVRPFILRRAKDSPEVELDLPPITVEKDYCRLTVEQASLYQATVDNWLPRIESHEDRFGRRGAVLAMLGHLKQVCNHPEMLLHTGAAARGPLREARASRRAAARRCPPTTRRSSSRSTRRSTGSCRTSRSARGAASASSTAA